MDLKVPNDFIAHLLVIDDDNRIRELLDRYLSAEGYLVSVAESADDAEVILQNIKFDLIISDKMMPGKDGIQLLTDIRGMNNTTPVIMLTAVDDMDTRLLGLSNGADDYIAKPFEPKELLLRIMNILKRTKPVATSVIKFGDFSFDTVSGILKHKEEIVKLTTAQKNIMNHFMNNINKVVSREDFARVLGTKDERSIDVAITRLRHKIEGDTKTNEFIITIRNVGYKFVI